MALKIPYQDTILACELQFVYICPPISIRLTQNFDSVFFATDFCKVASRPVTCRVHSSGTKSLYLTCLCLIRKRPSQTTVIKLSHVGFVDNRLEIKWANLEKESLGRKMYLKRSIVLAQRAHYKLHRYICCNSKPDYFP